MGFCKSCSQDFVLCVCLCVTKSSGAHYCPTFSVVGATWRSCTSHRGDIKPIWQPTLNFGVLKEQQTTPKTRSRAQSSVQFQHTNLVGPPCKPKCAPALYAWETLPTHFFGNPEGSHMVSQMVSKINLSEERAGMEGDSLSSERYCEASLAEGGSSFSPHRTRARRPSISRKTPHSNTRYRRQTLPGSGADSNARQG